MIVKWIKRAALSLILDKQAHSKIVAGLRNTPDNVPDNTPHDTPPHARTDTNVPAVKPQASPPPRSDSLRQQQPQEESMPPMSEDEIINIIASAVAEARASITGEHTVGVAEREEVMAEMRAVAPPFHSTPAPSHPAPAPVRATRSPAPAPSHPAPGPVRATRSPARPTSGASGSPSEEFFPDVLSRIPPELLAKLDNEACMEPQTGARVRADKDGLRQKIIADALSIQRQKSYVFDELSPDTRAAFETLALYMMAPESVGADKMAHLQNVALAMRSKTDSP